MTDTIVNKYVFTCYNASEHVRAFKTYRVNDSINVNNNDCSINKIPVICGESGDLVIQNPDSNAPCSYLDGQGKWNWVK